LATVGCIIWSRLIDDPPLSAHVRRGTSVAASDAHELCTEIKIKTRHFLNVFGLCVKIIAFIPPIQGERRNSQIHLFGCCQVRNSTKGKIKCHPVRHKCVGYFTQNNEVVPLWRQVINIYSCTLFQVFKVETFWNLILYTHRQSSEVQKQA
jgi:hypothetical protein